MILDAKGQWYTLENLEKVEHMQFSLLMHMQLKTEKDVWKFLKA